MEYEIIDELLPQLNMAADLKEASLLNEARSNVIAFNQGFVHGAGKTRVLLADARITVYNESAEEQLCIDELPYEKLCYLHEKIGVFKASTVYEAFKKAQSEAIERKKDFLFFKCDKGRDLHWCKGWYKAITYIDELMNELEREYRIKTETEKFIPSLFADK